MTTFAEAFAGVARTPDWTPWGAPRRAEHGVETAFHHALVLVRAREGGAIRVVDPGAAVVAGATGQLEWSPMPWALRGRREWRSVNGLGPGKIFAGADDRLFLGGDAVAEQCFEGAGLGPRGLNGWVETLSKRIASCEAAGRVYRHLVIPDQHAVHSDKIAGAPKLSPDRPLMRVLRHGGDALRRHVVYPLDEMIAGLAKAEVFYPHDCHYSGYGSFLCYRALMATLPGLDPARIVREGDLQVRTIFVAGDIARSVGAPGRRIEVHEPAPTPYKSIVKGTSYKTHQVDVYKTDEVSLPTLTLFRTSNSSRLIPFFVRHFSRIVAVASTRVFYDLVESERPDYVFAEMPERYFAMHQENADETDRAAPPDDTKDAFETRTGHKLPLPRD